jgi:hypothetical protein
MQTKLTRQDLYSLEQYAQQRGEFRAQVIAHKHNRRLALDPHVTLYFEDRLTVQYQIQEMLRIERIFEAAGIQDELDAYNPMIPDGKNWKATLMIEYPDIDARRLALVRLCGIERHIWVRVGEFSKVLAIADEDMEREAAAKTAAVHFLRFELSPAMIAALQAGAAFQAGIDHPEMPRVLDVPPAVHRALLRDLTA